MRKGINSLVTLVAWEIWKHRNDCVFNGASPRVATVLQVVENEGYLWCVAGNSALQKLLSRVAILGS
uniref:Uncharacterized protein n=1 Tax=Oryza brachyantha TaxID=4533 RepID=J3MRA8_ORYBR